VCLRMFGDVRQMVVDLTKEGDDKIDLGHGLLRCSLRCLLPTSLEDKPDYCNEVSLKLTPLIIYGRQTARHLPELKTPAVST
jgi:hypothetical protein